MRPRWQEVFDQGVTIEDFDFDDNEEEAKKYQVAKVPQLIIVDDQNIELERLVGMQDTERLQEVVRKYFNNK
jgi:predicted DsbA family dithiol-disulfide isomerase